MDSQIRFSDPNAVELEINNKRENVIGKFLMPNFRNNQRKFIKVYNNQIDKKNSTTTSCQHAFK